MRVPLGPALFCGVYLAVQLILAARGPLYPNEQIRFAWRMFLHSPRVTRYEIGFRDGRIVEWLRAPDQPGDNGSRRTPPGPPTQPVPPSQTAPGIPSTVV